jgi:hypothetical protein
VVKAGRCQPAGQCSNPSWGAKPQVFETVALWLTATGVCARNVAHFARRVRGLVAAIVVLASAGTGYVGSRIWPLPTVSGHTMHLAAAGDSSSTEPESRDVAPLLGSQVSKSAAATDPSPPPDESSQSAIAGAARLRDTARIEVESSSTSSPDKSAAVLYRSPAGQAHAEGGGPPATSTGSSRSERTAAARRWAPRAKASRAVRGQSVSGARPTVVEFAPNPKPNQASHDFMTRPSSF